MKTAFRKLAAAATIAAVQFTALSPPAESRGASVSPPGKSPRDSLVRVTLSAGEKATVLNREFYQVDSVSTDFGLAFTGPAGRYAIIVVSEGGLQAITHEIVGGGPPDPPPDPPGPGPGPGPGPDPKPPPPPPDDDVPPPEVRNLMGVGHDAWRAARRINEPAKSAALGVAAINASSLIHTGRAPVDAANTVGRAAGDLGQPWIDLLNSLRDKMTAAIRARDGSIMAWRDVYYELGMALQHAGGQTP